RNMRELFGEEAYATIQPHVERVLAGEKVVFERLALERGAGCYSLYHYVPDTDDHGNVLGFYAMVLDITPRRTAELQLAAQEKLLRGLTDHLPALVSYIDREERFQFNNQPYEAWLGKPLSEITGKHVREACGDEAYFKYKRFFDQALDGKRTDFAFANEYEDGKRYFNASYIPQFDEAGTVIGVCCMINDITEIKKVELQLIKLARVDSLTGLPNRVQFDESLKRAIARSRRGGLAMALMYLDIDRFKSINDTYGHQTGDEALVEFARRLQASVRKTDIVARLSGDEFVIILEEMKNESEVEIVANKIIAAMGPPFMLGGVEYRVTTSIGIAVLHDGDPDSQALLRRADKALYHAKAAGRNAFRSSEV
ncbi:MAG: diguanylate cyclase, partial [Burkholderiaceae bacterium]|nr:diguanylate cyclase [Burkholderiaceae bacterium]